MIVALEGLDGTGKSSAATLLGRALGARVLKTPAEHYGLTGVVLDDNPRTLYHFFFYLSAALWTSAEAQAEQSRGHNVVLDRYILSTFAYHAPFVNAPIQLSAIEHTPADLTVLLTCSEPERQRRLSLRGGAKSLIERIVDNRTDRDKMLSFYRASNAIELDTTNLCRSEVRDLILDAIGREAK